MITIDEVAFSSPVKNLLTVIINQVNKYDGAYKSRAFFAMSITAISDSEENSLTRKSGNTNIIIIVTIEIESATVQVILENVKYFVLMKINTPLWQ